MEKMESLLYNFNNLQSMIQYAETKNSLIIATTMAILSLSEKPKLPFSCPDLILLIGLAAIFCSMVNSLISMIPKTETIYKIKGRMLDSPNLFLFSEIALIQQQDEFIKKLQAEYYDDIEFTKQENDIVVQLYTLSQIASAKFKAFKISIVLFTFGAILNFSIIIL